jgi:single-stranded-DNA-specific exonuclease
LPVSNAALAFTPTAACAFGVAQSFSGRSWRFQEAEPGAAAALARDAGISQLLSDLLAARGVRAGEIADYLHPTLKRSLPEPLLLTDMHRAVERTRLAIDRGEAMAVFGDYDVDGSCSAALMCEFLSAIGRPPRIYIPDRATEGYGPNAAAMLKLKSEGVSLVITVDCGATAHAALSAAAEAGLDVIVLDHHATETALPCVAHVNPNQSGDASGLNYLCAAGVTFLFLVALNRTLRDSGWYSANSLGEPDLREHLDLVALATVCDVVPLIGINRAFVRQGLARLSRLGRPGLAALAAIAKVTPPCTPHHLGFMFGPRINAGGRVGRCSLGVELLTTRADAEALAKQLDLHNRERRAIESTILEEAIALAAAQANAPIVIVSGDGWHAGVVGIVAGRLRERFNKPAFAIGFEGGLGRGSARSVPGFDIGAVVRAARESGLLDSGGGHAMAAGLSLLREKLDAFCTFVLSHGEHAARSSVAANELVIEAVTSPAGGTTRLADEIERIGPFGPGNPEPLIAFADVRVGFADVVGKDHVRMGLVGGDGSRLEAIAFRSADRPLGKALLSSRGKPIHVAGRLRAEEWDGRVRVQLHLEDAAAATL